MDAEFSSKPRYYIIFFPFLFFFLSSFLFWVIAKLWYLAAADFHALACEKKILARTINWIRIKNFQHKQLKYLL